MADFNELNTRPQDFTVDELKALLKKLSPKEQRFVRELVQEMSCHHINAYCELGIYNEFSFVECNINKLVEFCEKYAN